MGQSDDEMPAGFVFTRLDEAAVRTALQGAGIADRDADQLVKDAHCVYSQTRYTLGAPAVRAGLCLGRR